jgi:hypothetical protein
MLYYLASPIRAGKTSLSKIKKNAAIRITTLTNCWRERSGLQLRSILFFSFLKTKS